MTDPTDASRDAGSESAAETPDADRRRFLRLAGSASVAGVAALAGCNGLDPRSNDGTTIEGDVLREAISTDVPAVPGRLQVDVAPSYLEQSARTARETLDVVPAPLTAAEIPNGEVRQRLTDEYDRANDVLDELPEQATTAEKLATLEYVHEAAGSAAAGWRTVDADYGFDELDEAARIVLDDLAAFRRRWRYLADDPVRAVLVHADVEHRVADAGQTTRRARSEMASRSESALVVSNVGGVVRGARTTLADARYLYDRFTDSLEEPSAVGAGLEAAVESLRQKLDRERESLPDPDTTPADYVDADLGDPDAVAPVVLRQLREVHAEAGLERERDRGMRASQVLTVHRALVRIRAFERFRERVERGDAPVVDDAEDVRTVHENAIDSLETVLERGKNPTLDRRVLADLARTMAYRTRSLADDSGGTAVRVENVRWRLSDVVAAEVQALATPAVSAEVVEVLDANLSVA